MKSYFLPTMAAVLLVSSCSVQRFAFTENVNVSREGKEMSLSFDGDEEFCFDIPGEYAYFSTISPESVIMFSKEMTEADLQKYNNEDTGHGSISNSDYEAWEEQWQKLARKYIRSDAEAIFTMPGKVTAFIADEIALEKMTPQPELIVFPPNYSELSWNYENFKDISVYERHITLSPLPDASKRYVYRNLIFDKKAGVAVVIDTFYTGEGQMIYLMYPIDGKKAHWIRDRYIHNPGEGLKWNPLVDLLMTTQYIRYYCDRMTWSIGSAFHPYVQH